MSGKNPKKDVIKVLVKAQQAIDSQSGAVKKIAKTSRRRELSQFYQLNLSSSRILLLAGFLSVIKIKPHKRYFAEKKSPNTCAAQVY